MQALVPEQDWLAKLKRLREDPWYFLTTCVYTLDPADKHQTIKKFPEYPYLKLYCRIWEKEKKLAVPKSRRMFMSWMNLALYLWDAMWHVGISEAFVSKKEDDANELIKKCVFILENIPKDVLPPEFMPKWDVVFGKLTFPQLNSSIQGFPQGADQLRQFTFSRILFDEMAFMEEAEKSYASSLPTLEGGGSFVGVSSPGPGFFKRLVFDKFDTAGATTEEVTLDKKFPIPGIEVWRNPKNKIFVFQLHYSANNAKNDPTYRDEIKSSMPLAQYMQEYELQWDSYAGQPVYPDFNKLRHGSRERLQPVVGLPLLRGWDFGLTPACVIAQLVGDQLRVLREFTATNMGADRFSDLVLQQCRIYYPNWANQKRDYIDLIDPSGFFRKDDQEGTCAKVLDSKGLSCKAGPVAWEARRSAVEKFIIKQVKDGPCFLIDLGTCPTLVRGFEGGYRYPEGSFDLEPNKIRPIKDEHSHPHDALQYIANKVAQLNKRATKHAPQEMSYGWQQKAPAVQPAEIGNSS